MQYVENFAHYLQIYAMYHYICAYAIHTYATQYGKDYTRPAMQIIAPYPDSLVTHLGVNKALKIGKT